MIELVKFRINLETCIEVGNVYRILQNIYAV